MKKSYIKIAGLYTKLVIIPPTVTFGVISTEQKLFVSLPNKIY